MDNKQAATLVLEKLRQAGFEALFAGGCVRDMLIGREPKDYDIATSAEPKEVCKLFRRRIEVGAKFGVVIVLVENEQVEVATFRTDGDYADGRRPSSITLASSREDALRRDFTINGMFYDPLKDEVIDYVGGRADLDKKLIRTIGLPQLRFGEDYLRMLRAIRFAAELDFAIEDNTYKAIKPLAHNIKAISGERIACELEKIFASRLRAKSTAILSDCGLLPVVFPNLSNEQTDYGIKVLAILTPPVAIEKALAALFIKLGAEAALDITATLMLSNNQIKAIKAILSKRQMLNNPQMKLSMLRPLLADKHFKMIFDVQRASQTVDGSSLENLDIISQRAQKLTSIELMPPPLLDGNEIIDIGAKKGPQIGEICRKLYKKQLDEVIKTKEQAIEAVKKWIKK